LIAAYQIHSWIDSWIDHPDEHSIDTTFMKFKTLMNCGDIDKAYLLMTPAYRAAHSPEDLREDYGSLCGEYGHWYVSPNRSITIGGDKAELYPGDAFRDIPWSGPIYHFARVEANGIRLRWRLTGTYDWSTD
jgi:hypothetical protein